MLMAEVSIRAAAEADLTSINDIYNYYVVNSTCTFQLEPETEEGRRAWFASHDEQHPVTVAELEGEVIGWGSLSVFRERAAYNKSVEASVYIRHDRLGHGLGRVLLVDLIERAKKLGYHTILGAACSEQQASIKLQVALGFQHVAHFREVGLKFGRWLDVEYLQLML
jgi:L-amino acid N-acyltransferase YncA